jgi:protein-tyrosine phosphatase
MIETVVASVLNLRDVGGHATRDGGHVRCGLLFRSGALAELDEPDRAALERLGLRTVYDLRSEPERRRLPDRLPRDAAYVALDLLEGASEATPGELFAVLDEPGRAEAILGGDRGTRLFTEKYREFVTLRSARAGLGRLFCEISEASARPALMHCATGKDRTGWAAAALLLLFGVPRATVMRDYLASGPRLEGAAQPFLDEFRARGGDPALLQPIMAVRPGYLAAALEEMERAFGTIEGYFEVGLGLAPAVQETLRSAFVEGPSTAGPAPVDVPR